MGEGRTGRYGTESGNASGTRISVDGAARVLGVTVDAIRKRVQRGTIPHERDESGRVWVLLEAASTMQDTTRTVPDNDQDEAGHLRRGLLEAKDENIADLKDRIASLERQLEDGRTTNRENRRLLAAALERIPAIEPAGARDEPETVAEASRGTETPEEPTDAQEPEGTASRPWWVRIFGG